MRKEVDPDAERLFRPDPVITKIDFIRPVSTTSIVAHIANFWQDNYLVRHFVGFTTTASKSETGIEPISSFNVGKSTINNNNTTSVADPDT
jgi:hypothetical protein